MNYFYREHGARWCKPILWAPYPVYPIRKKERNSLSRVRLFATPWTVAYQAPPPMGPSRQEYWSGLLFPSPGDLPDPEIEPRSPALQAELYHLSHRGSRPTNLLTAVARVTCDLPARPSPLPHSLIFQIFIFLLRGHSHNIKVNQF